MTDLYNQIVSQRGSFQRLLERIPGLRGYNDRADRRTADSMLREYLAGQVATRINRFTAAEKKLVEAGGLSHMSKTRNAKMKLQTYHDQLKAAAPGYSGFFAAIKIEAEELDLLYSFDEAQIRYVDRIEEAVAAFEQAVQANEGIGEAVDRVEAVATEASEAFALRENVITNLDQSLK